MAKVVFDLEQTKLDFQVSLNDKLQIVIDKFFTKNPNLNPEKISFLANGKKINPNDTVKSQISKIKEDLTDRNKINPNSTIESQASNINEDLTNGNEIKPNSTFESQISKIEEEKNILKITVINSDVKKEDIFIQAKEIICPQCNESCRIKIENGKIKLFGCINNHNYVEVDILNFKNTQKINISKNYM